MATTQKMTELERLRSECCTCESCGHVQAEPNWCHLCGHRVSMPTWARELLDERQASNDEAMRLRDVALECGERLTRSADGAG